MTLKNKLKHFNSRMTRLSTSECRYVQRDLCSDWNGRKRPSKNAVESDKKGCQGSDRLAPKDEVVAVREAAMASRGV
jgi:hypothetical protein